MINVEFGSFVVVDWSSPFSLPVFAFYRWIWIVGMVWYDGRYYVIEDCMKYYLISSSLCEIMCLINAPFPWLLSFASLRIDFEFDRIDPSLGGGLDPFISLRNFVFIFSSILLQQIQN